MRNLLPTGPQKSKSNQGKLIDTISLTFHSFFEKISTGSNTDSDLRVVRFDGGIAKEREMIDPSECQDEEDLPRFKKPSLSK